jgi:hypothetical protein
MRSSASCGSQEASSGGVQWKRLAADWMRKNLENLSQQALNELILDHISSGGQVDQVEETREEYLHCQHHYDFRMPILGRAVYVETVLTEQKMGPVVTIVNIHDA